MVVNSSKQQAAAEPAQVNLKNAASANKAMEVDRIEDVSAEADNIIEADVTKIIEEAYEAVFYKSRDTCFIMHNCTHNVTTIFQGLIVSWGLLQAALHN